MKELFTSYGEAQKYLFFDKINFFLAMIPVVIGIVIYAFLGSWIFSSLIPRGQMWISSYFSSDTMGDVVYYLLVGLMSVVVYLLVSWTLVLVISLIASPFNDLMSARIEKQMNGEQPEDFSKGMAALMLRLSKTLFNEIKKIIMILFFTIIALLLNLLPILVPLGILITAILLAVQFVDYSWSRHDLASKECYKDARRNWIPYALSGLGFLIVTTIPVVNLLLPSYATSYYTVLWSKLRKNLKLQE